MTLLKYKIIHEHIKSKLPAHPTGGPLADLNVIVNFITLEMRSAWSLRYLLDTRLANTK